MLDIVISYQILFSRQLLDIGHKIFWIFWFLKILLLKAPGPEGGGGGPRMVDPGIFLSINVNDKKNHDHDHDDRHQWSYSGDFEIYGMDGTGENDDDETPLVPADTPR